MSSDASRLSLFTVELIWRQPVTGIPTSPVKDCIEDASSRRLAYSPHLDRKEGTNLPEETSKCGVLETFGLQFKRQPEGKNKVNYGYIPRVIEVSVGKS